MAVKNNTRTALINRRIQVARDLYSSSLKIRVDLNGDTCWYMYAECFALFDSSCDARIHVPAAQRVCTVNDAALIRCQSMHSQQAGDHNALTFEMQHEVVVQSRLLRENSHFQLVASCN